MTVELIQRQRISWTEWATAIGEEIANARKNGFSDDGRDYYHLWLRSLENTVLAKGLSSDDELGTVKTKWHQAYLQTPHGQAVSIEDTESGT